MHPRFLRPWAGLRLLTAGAIDRLIIAAGVCVVLWVCFLWATGV